MKRWHVPAAGIGCLVFMIVARYAPADLAFIPMAVAAGCVGVLWALADEAVTK